MTRSAPLDIPVYAISVGSRIRPVDPARVANLKVSIEENGWFGAIVVRSLAGEEGEPRYELVAGAHRLAAMRALKRPAVPALVMALDADQAEQIEIDENLVRPDLPPLERAEMVERRRAVWLRRFPERATPTDAAKPARGRPRNSDKLAQFDGAPPTMGFAEETAGEIGLSKRTVFRSLEIVRHLPADLRQRLHGTWVAKNEGVLRQLAALGDAEEQAAVAALLIEGRTKNVADARAIAAGKTPVKGGQSSIDEALKALQGAWKKAPPTVRAAFLEQLAGQPLPKGWLVSRDG